MCFTGLFVASPTPGFDNTHIVIPTYNERDNIGRLIEEIARLYGRDGVNVWVMDDNSPDGTGEVVVALGERFPNVQAIVRTAHRGYGNAVADGMRKALATGAEFVLTMDADFSHSPAVIGKMLDAARDADLVIGSRYMQAGRAAVEDWSQLRLRMSQLANWYFRAMLDISARDNTSGFRCWRSDLLEKVLAQNLHASGYAFLTESLFYAARAGARIVEVANLYQGRTHGESKLSTGVLLESVWTALRLGLSRSR